MKIKSHISFAQKFFNTSRKINENDSLDKFDNWDSLKQIEMIVFIEKKIKKKLHTKEIIKIKKIKDLSKFFK